MNDGKSPRAVAAANRLPIEFQTSREVMMDEQPNSRDPVYRSSLAEMRWILLMWLICFVWTIGYSRMYGYEISEDSLAIVMGMPSWVFWGIFLPWIVASIVSCWYALTQIEDHPLDGPSDET